MDMIKPFFPFSFGKVKAKDETSLVVSIIIYIAAMVISGLVWLLFSWIPVINILIGIVGAVLELYCLAGIVLTVLLYADVLK